MESFINKEQGTLLKLVLKYYPMFSYGEMQSLLRKKDIKVNGERVHCDVKLFGGEKIEIYNKPKTVDVLYEDENIVVVHKPVGVECTKADRTYLGKSLEELTGYYACHRLDMNTEGLIVLAKNKEYQKEMFQVFKERNISKYYLCLVKGFLPKSNDTLTAYLIKGKEQVKIVDKPEHSAEKIITKYSVLNTYDNYSFVEVELVTGKTHQIRAHLTSIGNPIIGDNKYGDKDFNKIFGYKKQCLCSYKIIFEGIKGKLSYLNGKEIITKPSFLSRDKT